MQAQDLWEVVGGRKLPPVMFLFYSDKAWAPLSGQLVDCLKSVVLDGRAKLAIRLVCNSFGRAKAKIAAGPCGLSVPSRCASFLASKQTKLTTPLPAVREEMPLCVTRMRASCFAHRSWQKSVRVVAFGTIGCFLPWEL